MLFFDAPTTSDYGTFTVSGALVALAVREGFQFFSRRGNGNTVSSSVNQELQLDILREMRDDQRDMRDGIRELVQESRRKDSNSNSATAGKV